MVTVTAKSRAKIRTSMGDMTMEFLVDKAPRTVENFVTLANKGFYDGLTFHRIIKDFIVQGGCRNGDGTGKAEYTIRPEFNDTPHVKGVVSMARNNDPHSAYSQFFLCHGESRYLDSRYTAFGRVVEGLEVLDKIASVPTDVEPRFNEKSVPRDAVYINGIDLTDVEFEVEEQVPELLPETADEPGSGPDAERADAGGPSEPEDGAEPGEGEERRGRRTRRGGRGRRGGAKPASAGGSDEAPKEGGAERAASPAPESKPESKPKGKGKADDDADAPKAAPESAPKAESQDDDGDAPKPKKKATRRRRPASPKPDAKSNDEGD